MQIAIIGAGQVGGALAQTFARTGHRIVFGTRAPKAENEASIAEAVASAGISVLAVPFGAVQDVVKAAGGFDGKIVIDATNPLGVDDQGLHLTMGFTTSGAEQLAAMAPRAKVFKTFNQTGFANMADAGSYTARPVMFVAGDDAEAKPHVMQLVADAGFEAVDFGGLAAARLLEPLAMLWIDLAVKHGLGTNFAFVLERRV